MGCCGSKLVKQDSIFIKYINIPLCVETPIYLKDNLISKIFFLHYLKLDCTLEIEECFLSNDQVLATIFKKKQFCINKKINQLRELIETYDNLLSKPHPPNDKIRETETLIKNFFFEMSSSVIFENNNISLKSSSIQRKKLIVEAKSYCFDENLIKSEIIEKFKTQQMQAKTHSGIRRKYRKIRSVV